MHAPSDQNINEKEVRGKLHKYQQLAYKIRERRPGHHVEIIPLVIECIRGGVNKRLEQIARVLETGEKKMTWTWE